ncbi:MFS transporter [Sneathiella chungangensis]|uniref:MFS transporter n=1 Tax=Sneathiella chungangensis TaxID=1418234 RepID=A0A845ME37_9PROT|nr:MFS transporter [Sneathiella chungangensis]MZR21882.1 MFS transporter [Sneathiella chungangensis]
MWNSIKSVASLLASYGFLMVANAMFGTLLGLRSKLEGFSTEVTGVIMAGFFIGMLLGAVYAVRVVASAGHIRSFAAFASLMSVAVLAHVLIINPIAWLFLRALAGFCMAGMVMIVESWLNERSTNATRGQVLSLYMITNYLGAGSGQFLLTVANPDSFQLFSVASIIFSVALVPILLTRATAPKPSAPERMKFRDLVRISPVGVAGTLVSGLANSAINSMGPIFAASVGLSLGQISTFMASILLGGMLLQFPVGRLSDRFDRRTILIGSALAAALASGGILWAATGHHVLALFIFCLIYGGFCYTIYPMSSAQVNDLADQNRLVQVSAGLLLAYGTGASIGPIIASQIMGQVGPNGLFYYVIGCTLILAMVTVVRVIQRPSGKKKAEFLPLGSLGSSSKQLYSNVARETVKDDGKGEGNDS